MHSASLSFSWTSESWVQAFLQACQWGPLSTVQELCDASLLSVANPYVDEHFGFRLACFGGQLDIVQYLTTSSDFKRQGHAEFLDIHINEEEGFRWACMNGHLEVIRFLLTSPQLTISGHDQVDFHTLQESGFREACTYGHLEAVKFLTTNPELKSAGHTFVNIHTCHEEAFLMSCSQGHLAIVQFLTSSSELQSAGHSWVDVNSPEAREALLSACDNEQWEVIRWCLFELPHDRALVFEGLNDLLLQYEPVLAFQRIQQEQHHLQHCFSATEEALIGPPSSSIIRL